MCQVTQEPGTLLSHFRRFYSCLPIGWGCYSHGVPLVLDFEFSYTYRQNLVFISAVQQTFPGGGKHSVSVPSNMIATNYMCLLNTWEVVSAAKEVDFLFTPNKCKQSHMASGYHIRQLRPREQRLGDGGKNLLVLFFFSYFLFPPVTFPSPSYSAPSSQHCLPFTPLYMLCSMEGRSWDCDNHCIFIHPAR